MDKVRSRRADRSEDGWPVSAGVSFFPLKSFHQGQRGSQSLGESDSFHKIVIRFESVARAL